MGIAVYLFSDRFSAIGRIEDNLIEIGGRDAGGCSGIACIKENFKSVVFKTTLRVRHMNNGVMYLGSEVKVLSISVEHEFRIRRFPAGEPLSIKRRTVLCINGLRGPEVKTGEPGRCKRILFTSIYGKNCCFRRRSRTAED